MPITLQDAKATLNAFSGGEMFSLLKGNNTFHDQSHFSEHNARAALNNKPTCGYYYKTSSTGAWQSIADPTVEKDRLGKKDKKSQWKRVTYEQRHPVTVDDCLSIVTTALGKKSTASYKQHPEKPDSRFLYFAELTDPYKAATAHRRGEDTQADLVCLVFNKGGSWQLTTHFPCDSAYRDGFSNLT